MKIIIFLLLVSANAFGQLGPNELHPVKIVSPNTIESFYTIRLNEDTKFIRMDTTKGAVTFLKRGELVSYYTQAIKIDSVLTRRTYSTQDCQMVGCLVYHPILKDIEERTTVAIITKFGKRIDLSKNYTFIPESEMQE